MKDYYEVLGVSRDATTEEIRRAYRKKARELHPDYAGVESEEAFKEVSVAYQVLSDSEKRQRYDLGEPTNGNGYPGFAGGGFGFSDLFESMFNSMGGYNARGPVQHGKPGRDTLVAVEVTLEEIVFGTTKQVMLDTAMTCSTCNGSCAAPGTSPVTCATCNGTGSVTRIQNSLLGQIRMAVPCSVCQGQGQTIPSPCLDCGGEGRVRATRTISVDIPAGVDSGTRIRLQGQGEAGTQDAPSGDLYVEIRELPDEMFSRRGNDLHTSITIPMSTAALGTIFMLTTFDGEEEVEIPPGTQPGEDILLRGLGVKRLRSTGRGDLHVHVGVEVPQKLDERSRALLEELALHRNESRVEKSSTRSSGLFGKLKGKLAG